MFAFSESSLCFVKWDIYSENYIKNISDIICILSTSKILLNFLKGYFLNTSYRNLLKMGFKVKGVEHFYITRLEGESLQTSCSQNSSSAALRLCLSNAHSARSFSLLFGFQYCCQKQILHERENLTSQSFL